MIANLFTNAKVYGRYVKTCNYDGPKSWTKVKDFILDSKNKDSFNKINKILGNWEIQIKITSDSEPTNDLEVVLNYLYGELNIFKDNSDTDNNKIIKYQYALQTISIPNNNALTLDKLLQIGFNLGRLSVEINDSIFYGKFVDFYELNKLDNLNTYIKISVNKEKQIESNPDLKNFVFDINDFIIENICKLKLCSLDELQEKIDILNTDNDNNTKDNSNNYKNKYLNYKNKYMQLKKFL